MAKQLIWKSYSVHLKLTTFSYFQILPKKKFKWQLYIHEVYSLFLNSSTGNQLFCMKNFLNRRGQIKQYPMAHLPLKTYLVLSAQLLEPPKQGSLASSLTPRCHSETHTEPSFTVRERRASYIERMH